MKKHNKNKFRLEAGLSPGAAYLYLPGHPGVVTNCVASTTEITHPDGFHSIYDINFDYDKDGRLIGIELVD